MDNTRNTLVERQMNAQDEASKASAEKYIHNFGNEDISAQSEMKSAKERNSLLEIGQDYAIKPAKSVMKLFSRWIYGDDTDKKKDDKNMLNQMPLSGGAQTEGDKKIKGFNKKHIYIVGIIIVILVSSGIYLGGNSSHKKVKKEESDVNRGAITGMHMNTMPKDYSELAAIKKRQQAEADRLKAEEEARLEKERNAKKNEYTPVSQQVKSEHLRRDRGVYDGGELERRLQDGLSANDKGRDEENEIRRTIRKEYLERKKAALSSPIGFELKKR